MRRRSTMNADKIVTDAKKQRKSRIEELKQTQHNIGGYKRLRHNLKRLQVIEDIPNILIGETHENGVQDPEMLKLEDFNEEDFAENEHLERPLQLKSKNNRY